MTTGHSPLPWELFRFDGYDPVRDYPGKIVAHNGQEVFNGPFSFRALRGATDEEAQANAEYIVKAANNYPAMLEALRELADGMWHSEPSRDKARAVLATIGGETS